MYQKQKGLAMNCEERAKIYHIETKIVSLSLLARITEKIPPQKIGRRSLKVIENTRRKNIGFVALHDVDENKIVTAVSPRC
jgi:hypothetical protein